MKTMKLWRIAFMMLTTFSIASCGSDEPRYADPEAHEKTVKLNEQYGPLMFGTWHYENISDTQRYFERPHLRLRRRHHPPHPRLLRQRPRRLDQLPARPVRTKFLK